MSRFTADPLLGVARAGLLLIMAVIGLTAVAVALGIPLAIAMHGRLMGALTAHGGAPGVFWLVLLLLAAIAGILAMIFLFFRHLRRIVDSVAEGDPFVPANAQRLTTMAWLMLAVQIAAIFASALGGYIAAHIGDIQGKVTIGGDFGGIILILTLFVLARVFRRGAEMRAELEGTV